MIVISGKMKFPLGQVVATPGAMEVLSSQGFDETLAVLLTRHASGDWGEVCDEDKALNDDAVRDGGRIMSAYVVGSEKLWVITEMDRSVTTALRPDDY